MRNGPTVYNGHLRGPVALTPVAERLAVVLSLPVATGERTLISSMRGKSTYLHHRATEFHISFIIYGSERKQKCQIVFEKRVRKLVCGAGVRRAEKRISRYRSGAGRLVTVPYETLWAKWIVKL